MAVEKIQSPSGCPKCGREVALVDPMDVTCTDCRWRGEVHLFAPPPLLVVKQSEAMPDDATCVHHPSKRAITTCAGSGDYICPLCLVEIDGQTFGAAYLATAGKAKASKAFERYLPRPDIQIVWSIYLTLVLARFIVTPLITIPWGFVQFFKMLKLRREDSLYSRVVSRGRAIWLGILIFGLGAIVALIVFGLFVPLVIAIGNRK